jgi:hypothetical protein
VAEVKGRRVGSGADPGGGGGDASLGTTRTNSAGDSHCYTPTVANKDTGRENAHIYQHMET